MDLFGVKNDRRGKRYWLTRLARPYKVVRSFGLNLFPMDMNVLCDLQGAQIFLYDTAEAAEAPSRRDYELQFWRYYNRLTSPNTTIWKLAQPIEKRIRLVRRKKLLHPFQLIKSLWEKAKRKRAKKK